MAGAAGPDGLWSEELPPSRGQLATIAELALKLMGQDKPTSRLEASITISRLHAALADPNVARAAADLPF